MDLNELRADLLAEQAALDAVVATLPPEAWAQPTASPRWSVADQITHLAWFDEAAVRAITEPADFVAERDALVARMGEGDEAVDAHTLGRGRRLVPPELLAWWRQGRAALDEAASTLGADRRIEWVGPPMGAASLLTARLMETWAHGQDVVDAVGGDRPATDRLRHIVHLGVLTRSWSYRNRGLEVPAGAIRVELVAPSGETWSHQTREDGPVVGSVTGPAEDFCLVVTQRRALGDTVLVTEGDAARDWMLRAQAYAGPPTDGPGVSGTGS